MMRSDEARDGFHELGFAGQMIVWATRKRLHVLRDGGCDADVLRVFRLGGLQDLHAALMRVIDILICGGLHRIELHGVSCPCLAPHEIALLDAFTNLQHGRDEQASGCLSQLLCRPAIAMVLPAMRAIVCVLDAGGLRIEPADGRASTPRGALGPSPTIH